MSRIGGLADRLVARLTAGGPPLAWTLRDYRRSVLRGDAIGGITVAALIIPLSIGYAQVAGLPPEAGLYASLVPLLAYAVFGSARRLIVGPDAATAALVGAAVIPLAVVPDDRIRLASALALLVAIVFVGMRAASLGFLADFLSRPILVGYMTGVGISVALDQIPKILGGQPLQEVASVLAGTDLAQMDPGSVMEAVGIALAHGAVNLPSVVIGVLVFAAIVAGDRWLPGVPVALPALGAALVATVVLGLAERGVLVLGPVPAGLPPVGLPLVSIDEAVALLPSAIGIAILSFADTVLTGRSFSGRHGEETDPDRELVALAASDFGASLTSGYPVSSSPSRTAAAEASGATTQLAGVIAAGAVALVLLFLAGLLTNLPIPALGAVVLASALRFIDIRGVIRVWRLQPVEGAIAVAATVGVLVYGTLAGVGIAAMLAAFNVFRRAAQPRIDELGRLPDSGVFADLHRDASARRVPGVLIVRFAGPLFFATSTAIRSRIRALLAERSDVERVVIDAAPIVDLDLTAADGLRTLQRDLAKRGVELVMARPNGQLRDLLRDFGLDDLAGDEAAVTRTLGEVVAAPRDADRDATIPEPGATSGSADVPEIADDQGPEPGPPIATPIPIPSHEASEGLRRWSTGIAVLGGVIIVALVGLLLLGDRPPRAPDAIVAPNLIGLPLDRARAQVDALGLTLAEPTTVQTDRLPEATVLAQDPTAGTPMARGDTIETSVATSRGTIVVPDVAGMTQPNAIVALTTAGLYVAGTTARPDAAAPSGSVIATEPAAGREVAIGTRVTLVLSSGPAPEATPSPTVGSTPAPSGEPIPSVTPGASSPTDPTPATSAAADGVTPSS